MPSKKQYNLVNDDTYDSRIPLYNEEAFQHGITFHAKYIGSLDVPRPSSRVEIVAAMRRIRYEFKAKSMKKKKVGITVSVDGVKVVLRSKRRSNQWPWDENKFIIMHHPIYRIFYVSHDSQDLKIFSYIARDGGSNAFKCNVFKSKKKSQAMRIVRTIGQAFEVCHKLSLALASSSGCGGETDVIEDNNLNDPSTKGKSQGDGASEPNSCDTQEETSATKSPDFSAPHSPLHSEESDAGRKVQNEPLKSSLHSTPDSKFVPESSSLSVYHNIQMLKEQLEQQHQQMQSVVGQVQLLKDQLSAETTARLEAQSQNHQLLAHNRELLEHIKRLVNHIQEMEQRFHMKEQNGNSQPGSFLPFSTSESNTVKNSEKNTGSKHTPDNITIQDDPFSSAPLPKNIFGRQLSIPPNHSPGGGSPRSGTSPRDSCHSAMSLPADSPSQRCNFRFDSDAIFRSDSFACSSPKPSRKDGCSIPISSPTFLPGAANSPGHLKSGSHQAFDFDAVASYGGSASLFKYNNGVEQDGLNARPNAKSPFRYGSSETAVNSDSFIAQVARDLAKMNTFDRDAADVSHNASVNSGFSTLFKS